MNIGLLGHGIVGAGVDEILKNYPDIKVKKVLSLIDEPDIHDRLALSFDEILNDPEIDTVVEAMGGIHPAADFMYKALNAGKNVVTSNKAALVGMFDDLVSSSFYNKVSLRAGASCGGGIPWLSSLERALRVDKILMLQGIMNGTTNYILSCLNETDMTFEEALKKAQELGYAEKDPSSDIDGLDTRRKLTISLNIAYNVSVNESDIPVFGIRSIKKADIAFAKAEDAVIRLIATAKKNEDGTVSAFVEPVLVPSESLFAGIKSNYNLFLFEGSNSGIQTFSGQGAGRYPTAYNVVQDILDIKENAPAFYAKCSEKAVISNENELRSYYVRTFGTDAFLDSASESREFFEETGICIYITEPVSVKTMHEYAEKKMKEDADFFMAEILY